MINAASRFTRGLFKQPLWVQVWVGVLMCANGIAPLFFLGRLEAQIVLGAFALAGLLMTLLTARAGFSRLLGLGHFPWFVLVAFLWSRLGEIPASDAFGMWVRAVIVIDAISLLFDVADVARYAFGEREETVAGL